MKYIALAIVASVLIIAVAWTSAQRPPERREVDGLVVKGLQAEGWECDITSLEPIETIGRWICTAP